jgi:hypothetical protein
MNKPVELTCGAVVEGFLMVGKFDVGVSSS